MAGGQGKKALHVLSVFLVVMTMQRVGAREFTVGGTNGWSVPADAALSYTQWAERNRFQIGDSLLFVYPSDKDSVQYVNEEDYKNCHTAAPLEQYNDGHTVFTFNHSGPHYFISGVEHNCLKNQKLAVVVLAHRGDNNAASPSPTASPPPSSSEPTEMVPTPAPAGEESPSPAPGGEEPSPPSGASSVFISSIGSMGAALLGSSLLLY